MKFDKSGNPALNESMFQGSHESTAGKMTVAGAINKTLFLLILAFVAASFTWRMTYSNPSAAQGLMILGAIGGFITALITIFSKTSARFTAPIYAVFEGLLLGAISAMYNMAYGGIVLQALFLTFITAGGMLFLYQSGIVKVTEKFRAGLISAMMALLFTYLISFVLSMFGWVPSIYESGPIGIIFSLVVVIIAALNLVLDFDLIAKGAKAGAPEYMEWYSAFALMVTLVWLYLEILRLLAKLQRRR
jgi:uncharacterized YccA/Bax inhibitor family protein